LCYNSDNPAGGREEGLHLMGLNVRRIAVTFIIVLLILYGGKAACYNLRVSKPLHQYFQTQTCIADYSIYTHTDGLHVKIKPNDVKVLQSLYAQLRADITEILGKTPFVIDITDERNPMLEEIFYSMRIHIEEALARGSFYDMSQAIDKKAKKAGLDKWDVGIDSDYIYVQLHQRESYLYEIIPR
jgi:hypothetical protein